MLYYEADMVTLMYFCHCRYIEALMRKMSNTFISRLISSDNAIIKVLLDNMVARERMWEYWYSILY